MYTLITGASSGIGKALAIECAAKGMNLLLVALGGLQLDEVAIYIKNNYKVKCDCLGIDLSSNCSSQEVYQWVKQNNYSVNTLINNVGIGSKGNFENLPPDFYATQINLNIVTTCLLTRLFIPDLKANAPSYIMNVGSMGGFFIIPDKTVYSATKAFVYSFSRSLQMELRDSGIGVSVLCPGGTDTNANTTAINADLKGFAKRSILTSEEVAKEAIPKMLKGHVVIIPGFLNKCYYTISQFVPEFVRNFFVKNAFKHVNKHNY
jgi:short-subunit dehydrogenase